MRRLLAGLALAILTTPFLGCESGFELCPELQAYIQRTPVTGAYQLGVLDNAQGQACVATRVSNGTGRVLGAFEHAMTVAGSPGDVFQVECGNCPAQIVQAD